MSRGVLFPLGITKETWCFFFHLWGDFPKWFQGILQKFEEENQGRHKVFFPKREKKMGKIRIVKFCKIEWKEENLT